MSMPTSEGLERMLEAAYRFGMRDGITAFAIWKNGQQVVGCMERPAGEVLADLSKVYGYSPPTEAEVIAALSPDQSQGSPA